MSLIVSPVFYCCFLLSDVLNSDSSPDLSEVVKSENLTDAESVYSAFELGTGIVSFFFFFVLSLPCVKLWDFRSKAS